MNEHKITGQTEFIEGWACIRKWETYIYSIGFNIDEAGFSAGAVILQRRLKNIDLKARNFL